MNKKLMAVAVAGALAAPAAALAQNYSIYGRASVGVDMYEAKGAVNSANDYKSRPRVFDSSSRLGFQGSEDLGGGLRAVFLMESGVNIDTGSQAGQSGAANTSTGFLSSRIGHVGLAGGFGQVTFGRSNVWWANGAIDQVGANWLNAACQMCSGTFGRGMGVGVSRFSNTVQYTTPTFSGVNFILSWAAGAEAQGPGAAVNSNLLGLTAQGTHGPFAWGFDFATVDQNNLNELTGRTTALKLRGGWRYVPAGQISLIAVNSNSEKGGVLGTGATATGFVATCNTVATACTLEQQGIAVSWDHMFGAWQPVIQYNVINKITGSGCDTGLPVNAGVTPGTQCDDTEANQITVATKYNFSKRTHAYVSYNKITNKAQYNQDYNGASITSRTAANQVIAADPQIIAVGMIHNF